MVGTPPPLPSLERLPDLAGGMNLATRPQRFLAWFNDKLCVLPVALLLAHFFDLPDDYLNSLFTGNPDELPAGEPAAQYTFDYGFDYLPFFGAQTADLYGVFPHMHQRGRKLKVEPNRGRRRPSQCAADVQAWDFGWQIYYFYDQPVPVTTKSVLRITCEYDTQSASEPVLPGWGTQNEMCLAGLFVVPNL